MHYLGISKRAKAAAVYGDKNVSETKIIIIHLSDNTQWNLITLSYLKFCWISCYNKLSIGRYCVTGMNS